MITTNSPYYSSGIVERAKRERAWNHPTRERRDAAAFSRGMICTFFLPFFCTTLHFVWRKCRGVFSFTFFSLPLIFILDWWPLAFLILPPPLQNFHVVLPTEKCLLCFLSLALDLCRLFSRWASLACRPLSLFLCRSLALYSKFEDMTINPSLIL